MEGWEAWAGRGSMGAGVERAALSQHLWKDRKLKTGSVQIDTNLKAGWRALPRHLKYSRILPHTKW